MSTQPPVLGYGAPDEWRVGPGVLVSGGSLALLAVGLALAAARFLHAKRGGAVPA